MFFWRRRTLKAELSSIELSIRRAGDIRRELVELLVPCRAEDILVGARFFNGSLTIVVEYVVVKNGAMVPERRMETTGTSRRDAERVRERLMRAIEERYTP